MQRKSRKTSSLLILGTLIFAGIIFILFSYYQSWLNVKFEQQVMENYTAYIESEGAQFSGAVVDIQDTLETLAALIPANNPNWDADTLNPMLADLTMRNTHFEIHSLTLSEAGLDEAQQNQLIQSGTLITAIENHPSGKAYFQVLAPLMRQNQLEAVLQAQVDITQLLHKSQSKRVSAPLNSWIILPEGSFIYTTSPSTSDYSNFYALLEGNHNPEATQMQIRNCLQAQTSGTFRVQTRKAGMLYVSLTPLGFNNWTLVNFIHANEASESSQMILLFTMRIGLFLILITAGIAYLFYALLNHQRRQINLEQRRYAFLSRFSDTLIFEYDVLKDTLELTSNAEKILPIKARSFTHVKKNHGLSLYIHAEDFYKLEEAFKTVHRFQEFGTVQLRIKTRDESYHWFTCQFQAVYERFHRDPVMIIGKLNDIQEQKYRERQLIEKSNYDGLTSVLNKKAAELSGIHTDRTRMAAFVIVGFCVAVGSIFTTSRLQSTTAVLGTGLEFNVIAAVVVGGCALDGGRGDVIGTVIGALFMSVLDNGIYKYQINTAYQPIIKGAIIILVVVFDAWYNKRMEQASKNRKRLCEEVTAS